MQKDDSTVTHQRKKNVKTNSSHSMLCLIVSVFQKSNMNDSHFEAPFLSLQDYEWLAPG
jgi:hypothetical protein